MNPRRSEGLSVFGRRMSLLRTGWLAYGRDAEWRRNYWFGELEEPLAMKTVESREEIFPSGRVTRDWNFGTSKM